MGNQIETKTRTTRDTASEGRCPYYDCNRIECRAATSNCYLNRKVRLRFCLDDNFENCAVFLAKVLRGGRIEAHPGERRRRCLILTGAAVDSYRYSAG